MPDRLVTPEDFGLDQPPERIIGLETEYDIRQTNGQNNLGWLETMFNDETLALLGLAQTGNEVYHWLSNGALMYPDVGHLEYCTPESLGPLQATAAAHAGSILLDRLVQAAQIPYAIYRRSATVHPETGEIFTKGFHVNFCIPDAIATREKLHPLESHFATQIYAWGGLVTKQGYNISPKARDLGAPFITSLSDRTRAGHKPMAIIRASISDSDTNMPMHGLGRLEDRTKTPSSPWSDFMGMVTTSLLLRVIEHPAMAAENQKLRGLALYNPTASIKSVSADMALTGHLRLADGRHMTGLDIQEAELDAAEIAVKKLDLALDEQFGVLQWREVIDKLRQIQRGEADVRLIADRVGWASKFVYLRAKLGEQALRTGTIDALRYCLGWDRVAPHGAGQIFDEKRGPAILPADSVEKLTTQPPQGTRAKPRAEYIANQGTANSDIGYTRWPFVTLQQGEAQRVVSLHPYETKRPKLGSRNGRKW